MPITLEKDAHGLRIRLDEVIPTVHFDAEAGRYRLCLESRGDDEVCALLNPAELQALALQCLAVMPEIEPKYTVAGVEEAFRRPARILKLYDDRAIQLLLREVHAETLINGLWYMKDRELIQQVVRNMSQRAGEALVEDLTTTWSGKNPDTALEAHARLGRKAVLEIMALLRKLIDEGQIQDINRPADDRTGIQNAELGT